MFKQSKLINEPKGKVLNFTRTLKANYTIVEYTTLSTTIYQQLNIFVKRQIKQNYG